MGKKKILLFTDWYEPGYKAGGPIQSIKNFVQAAGDCFEIYIVTSDRDLGEKFPYSEMETGKWIRKNDQLMIYYLFPAKLTISKILGLTGLIRPDLVYLNSMYSLRFTILPLLAFRMKNTGARIILAPRGMLQEGAMHFKTQKKKFFIGLLKFMGIASKIHFHATDDQERMDVLHYFPANAGISVVPNFPKSSSGPFKTTLKEQGTVLCIFISRIAPKKNLLYLLELLDALPERINLRLDIYGESEDEAYFEKCRQVISKFPQHISVNFKGSVPNEEAHAVLEANHLFVLPTKGENFGHAIYESLLAGRPVLISDRTPWKGMQAKKAGWDIPLEKPVEFLKAIQEMAEFDQQEFDDWCLHAWEYARQYRDSLTNLKEDYLKLFS